MMILNIQIELFREAIRRRRLELGISQKELAQRVGYKSASTISRIERGDLESPVSKLEDFAKALETDSSNLISDVEKRGMLLDGTIDEKPSKKYNAN